MPSAFVGTRGPPTWRSRLSRPRARPDPGRGGRNGRSGREHRHARGARPRPAGLLPAASRRRPGGRRGRALPAGRGGHQPARPRRLRGRGRPARALGDRLPVRQPGAGHGGRARRPPPAGHPAGVRLPHRGRVGPAAEPIPGLVGDGLPAAARPARRPRAHGRVRAHPQRGLRLDFRAVHARGLHRGARPPRPRVGELPARARAGAPPAAALPLHRGQGPHRCGGGPDAARAGGARGDGRRGLRAFGRVQSRGAPARVRLPATAERGPPDGRALLHRARRAGCARCSTTCAALTGAPRTTSCARRASNRVSSPC